MWVDASNGGSRLAGSVGPIEQSTSGSTPPGQPPIELTSFVGRGEQIAELKRLVDAHRLVTITGPGGCGKTRLAIELLRARPSKSVAWVDLATVDDPGAVPDAAADAFGVALGPRSNPGLALSAALRDRHLVVGFDNCEHVVDVAGELIEQLLRACPGIRVVATSREPLGSAAEVVWRVPPMEDDDVVALFVERARAARADFQADNADHEAVRTVCRRLDGIPLAVEFAAAWVRTLTPGQIAAALDDRFAVLVGTHRRAVARQRTLLASLDWSFNLLRDDARRLLPRLSVFAGDFSVDDVLAVCIDDDLDTEAVLPALARLVDTSMVAVEQRDGVARYHLPETIKEYAAALLGATGETADVRARHLAHAASVAERLAVELDEHDQDVALAGYRTIDQNLRAALGWGLAAGDPGLARRLAAASVHMWFLRGRTREAIDALERAVALGAGERSPLQAELWAGLALVAIPAGRVDLNVEASQQAIELATAIGDSRALGRATAAATYGPFYSDFARCEELAVAVQACGEEAGDTFCVDFGMLMRAGSLGNRDRFAEAIPLADEVHERALARNNRFLAFSRLVRLEAALLTGDVRAAVDFGRTAVELARPLRDYLTLRTVTAELAWAMGMAGDLDGARQLTDPLVAAFDRVGTEIDVLELRVAVGKLHFWAGELDDAEAWLGAAAQVDGPDGDTLTAVRALPALSTVLRHLGHDDHAADLAQRGIEMAQRLGTPHPLAESLDALARVVTGDPGRAESLHHEAVAIRCEHGLRTHLADSLDALSTVVARRGDHEQAARLLGAGDAARDESGYPRPPVDQPALTRLEESLSAALGEGNFDELRRDGSQLGLDDAVAYATRGRGPRGRPSLGWDSLTPTERDVVALVAEGLTNPQIAERLFVSPATVKTHVSHIFAKVGASSRAELAAAVTRHHGNGS